MGVRLDFSIDRGAADRPPLILRALEANDDVHLVAKRPLHEFHVIITPLDREAGFTPCFGVALGTLRLSSLFEVRGNRFGYTMQSHVTGHFVSAAARFNFRALECDRRELRRVKKIRAL